METNKSLAQVRQEWKPYATGNSILKAQSSISIRQRSDEELKEALRYVMVIVGLREINMPSAEEKFVLINFIKSNYGNQTPDEIRLAFEYAIAGKFEVDAKCYENFSCEYFSRIMKAYIEYSRNELKTIKPIEEVKPIPSDKELKKQAIDIANDYADQIDKARSSNEKYQWYEGGLGSLYSMLEKFKIHCLNNEERWVIWNSLNNITDEDVKKMNVVKLPI